jgi:hypothetical protein
MSFPRLFRRQPMRSLPRADTRSTPIPNLISLQSQLQITHRRP